MPGLGFVALGERVPNVLQGAHKHRADVPVQVDDERTQLVEQSLQLLRRRLPRGEVFLGVVADVLQERRARGQVHAGPLFAREVPAGQQPVELLLAVGAALLVKPLDDFDEPVHQLVQDGGYVVVAEQDGKALRNELAAFALAQDVRVVRVERATVVDRLDLRRPECDVDGVRLVGLPIVGVLEDNTVVAVLGRISNDVPPQLGAEALPTHVVNERVLNAQIHRDDPPAVRKGLLTQLVRAVDPKHLLILIDDGGCRSLKLVRLVHQVGAALGKPSDGLRVRGGR